MLLLKDVNATTLDGKKILENIHLEFKKGTVNLVLGPNGSGKTTLAEAVLGNTDAKIKGQIFFDNKEITSLQLEERARLGIFLAYQNPVEIPGVKIMDFLHNAYNVILKKSVDIWEFHDLLTKYLKELKLEESFLERSINEGFSGGEKKKFEILQILLLKPKLIILDEIDSGLDIDSTKEIFSIIKNYHKENNSTIILISHSSKILQYISPDKVVLMKKFNVVEEGDIKLAKQILKHGYAK